MSLDKKIDDAVIPPAMRAGEVTLSLQGDGATGDIFAVAELAAYSIAAAAQALARYAGRERVDVDRRLASLWFNRSFYPQDRPVSRAWDELSGDYLAGDGWIRLHCNVAAHRAAVESLLERPRNRAAAASRVRRWAAADLERAVVEAGGAAAMMLTAGEWAKHPQGRAVAAEPLVAWRAVGEARLNHVVDPGRPLAGLKLLDLTRILAGPAATRFLAGFGAGVLRIDPPGWDETGNIPEMTPGKKCATLDLRNPADRRTLAGLIAKADILVHGYRADALERLGLGDRQRRELNPGLIDVALDAYGWTGPWRTRRGFDSLVQMSSGIAAHGMQASDAEQPRPLTAQALDHATGYLLAAAALNALRHRRDTGQVSSARLSLAATAELLKAAQTAAGGSGFGPPIAAPTDAEFGDAIEVTAWGPARRLRFPAQIDGLEVYWDSPAVPLHTSAAEFG